MPDERLENNLLNADINKLKKPGTAKKVKNLEKPRLRYYAMSVHKAHHAVLITPDFLTVIKNHKKHLCNP